MSKPSIEVPEKLKKYIGVTEAVALHMAVEDGYKCRVTCSDGVHYIVTADYRMDRINFHLEGGNVVGACFG